MKPILNTTIPYDPLSPAPLPGIAPLDPRDWLQVNEAYAGQIARRTGLLKDRREAVLWADAHSEPAVQELLDEVIAALPPAFGRDGETILCPDGRRVDPDRSQPFDTLARLVTEDFCILEKQGDEHVLQAALLCFPASWMLSEKAGRPLIGIHDPVEPYDANIAKRVQRLFDAIRPGRPLWRFNALWYDDADLFQPRSETDRRRVGDPDRSPFLRSERQSLWRLPQTGAVVFSIHTYVLPRAAVMRPATQGKGRVNAERG